MSEFIPSDKHIFTEKTLENIDVGVIYASMVANDKSIFLFGGDKGDIFEEGSLEVREYSTVDNCWYRRRAMPRYLWGSTAEIIDGNIFIMGGGLRTLYTSYNSVYNVGSSSWSEKAGLPISRKGLVSGVIDDIIYIAYGYRMWGIYDVTSYCYAYNPKTDIWTKCQSPLGYKSYAMSVVINKYLYVLGGYSPENKNGDSIKMDRYCPRTNSWETMPDMPRSRKDAVAVAIDSKIFILCGGAEHEYTTMDYYDTKTRKWTMSDIPTPQVTLPVAKVIDNKIYLTAGKDRLGEYNKILYEITYGGMKEEME